MRVPLKRTIKRIPSPKVEYVEIIEVIFYPPDREGLEQALEDRGFDDVMLILNKGLEFIAGCDKRMELAEGPDWRKKHRGPSWGEGLSDDIIEAVLRAKKESR